ncbi:MAG: hypothetical protein AAF658_08770, partial [Myxococcota bacterium]
GDPLPARVVVLGRDPDGTGPAPATADPNFGAVSMPGYRSAPRASGSGNVVHLVDGTGSVQLPTGTYQAFAMRGLEYSLDRFPADGSSFSIVAGQTLAANFVLERLLDDADLPGGFASPLQGYVSADLAAKTGASLDSALPQRDRLIAHLASGIEVVTSGDVEVVTDLGASLIALDDESALPLTELLVTQRGVSSRGDVGVFIGGVLELNNGAGTQAAFPLPFSASAPRRGAPYDEYRLPAERLEDFTATGAALRRMVTPRLPVFEPPFPPVGYGWFTNGKAGFPQPGTGVGSLAAGGYTTPLSDAGRLALVDLISTKTGDGGRDGAFELIDVLSSVSFYEDPQLADWFALTSAGLIRTATGASLSTDLESAAGFPRVFVAAPPSAGTDLNTLDLSAFNSALRPSLTQGTVAINAASTPSGIANAMNVLVSSGPVVFLEVDADEDGVFEGRPGSLVEDDGDGSVDVRVTVLAAPWVPIDSAQLTVNGGAFAGSLTGSNPQVIALGALSASPSGDARFGRNLADIVRARSTVTVSISGGNDDWIIAQARGTADELFREVVGPSWTAVTGLSNPVFISDAADGDFDPNGVP